MKLSEAMLLGSTGIKLDPAVFYMKGNSCGCLIGMGQFAVDGGVEATDYKKFWPWLEHYFPVPEFLGLLPEYTPNQYRHIYPGMRSKAASIIGHMANRVQLGHMTIEQAADWIRANEPPDPSELLKEVDEAVGEGLDVVPDPKPMDMYERWERSQPERQG